ncbi:hypothetical protein M5D96_000545 [Drosophila gunungcola]|uniref:Uncharacterized protein n=1 Tax=Drosophila gunungcola TaxID=103775 RepID=A0A9Q0BTR0_9MUSC|nr:hypothetical protein M5D96_000545 [Drosophila gunungcola]
MKQNPMTIFRHAQKMQAIYLVQKFSRLSKSQFLHILFTILYLARQILTLKENNMVKVFKKS